MGKALWLSKNQVFIILIVESGGMLTETKGLYQMFKAFDRPVCRNIAMTVVAYLSREDIQSLCEAFKDKKGRHFLVQMVRNMKFINNYINATDKSLYFTFFDDEQYKKIEIQQIAAISQKNYHMFQSQEQAFADVTAWLTDKVPVLEEQMEMLTTMVVNPDLPLPQMKRQTQGMYCTSPFQLFLVHETFAQNMEEQLFTNFEKLQQFFSLEQEEEYLKQFMLILKDKSKGGTDLKKIMKVRYTPYEINSENYKEFNIENNQLHNFIVGLFALSDIMLDATHLYIRSIVDPLHKMVQLTLRYNIYRNFVLGVEQMLAFVFKMYENIYHEAIQSHSKPQFKFWRPALTKWFLKMNPLHQEGQEVYMHCLIKLRISKLKQELSSLYNSDQIRFGKLLQAIEMNNFQYEFSEKILKWGNGSSELSQFFDQHLENYEIVVMEFNDYMVDLSVNQQTVHWCGHSEQQLQKPYLQYQNAVVSISMDFMDSLVRMGKVLSKQDVFEIIKVDTEYISTLQIKNRTLKKMLESLSHEYSVEKILEERRQELSICGSFDEADRKLEYFNHKALIMAVIDENARPFYSIPPLCSPEKLIDMIDTNDSENNNSEAEEILYNSENEEQNKGDKAKRQFAQYDSDEDLQSPKGLTRQKTKGKVNSKKTFLMDEQEEEEEDSGIKCRKESN